MKKEKEPKEAYKDSVFLNSPEARSIRILSEYLEPLSRLNKLKVKSTILFVGSTRAKPYSKNSLTTKYYWEAEKLAYKLTKWAIKLKPEGKNFVICTGGGPGIMEAANRGAARAGGKSIGMNISLSSQQNPNPYISSELSFIFHYFFMRKFWLISKAKAVVAFPGGFGTLDEVVETLTLIQTKKIQKEDMTPLLLYGKEYWQEVINFDALLKYDTIAPEDINLFSYCSTPTEAFSFLKERLEKFLL
ncbi:MAG: LOG family protein [Acidobacteriota bacterium]|nr:LOG family protein [Acidobacteriota bacterium]